MKKIYFTLEDDDLISLDAIVARLEIEARAKDQDQIGTTTVSRPDVLRAIVREYIRREGQQG